MKPSESPTFCPLMWLGANHWNSGEFAPCCVYRPSNKSSTWDKGFVDRPYKAERKALVQGHKPLPCHDCWKNEEVGVRSLRQEAIEDGWWRPYRDIIDQQTKEDGSFVHDAVYFDLRLGTKCNLSCRMCSASSSSLIEKEQTQHQLLFEQVWGRDESFEYAKSHPTTEEHIDSVFDYIQSVDKPIRLKFTGGEPFLNKRIPDFIHQCIKSGRSKNIKILFITNLTTVQKSLMEAINENFERFELVISMEGIEDAYEYIRYPTSWSKFQHNFNIIKQLGIKFNICYTANSLSICEFTKWLDWVKQMDGPWDFNPVIGPSHYATDALPEDLIQIIQNDIRSWMKKNPDYYKIKLVEGAVQWLSKPQNKKAWFNLKKDTDLKDSIRKQSINRSIPKLAAYF